MDMQLLKEITMKYSVFREPIHSRSKLTTQITGENSKRNNEFTEKNKENKLKIK